MLSGSQTSLAFWLKVVQECLLLEICFHLQETRT